MDRELVLLGLGAMACGPAIATSVWWEARRQSGEFWRLTEAALWRRMFLPLLPAGLLAASLLGWALMEPPVSDERIPPAALVIILPFCFVCGRAAWRAVRALRAARDPGPAATFGLLRPRIVLSASFRNSLDPAALQATLEHEGAHVRHRDPLRVLLAQVATDLQWPWSDAIQHLNEWREMLELTRDEEARRNGAGGPDLAAAILVAMSLPQGDAMSAARLRCDSRALQRRIQRLLAPLEPIDDLPTRTRLLPLMSWGFAAFFVAGCLWGDTLLHHLFARL